MKTLVLLFLVFAVTADARTFKEQTIECESLIMQKDGADVLHAIATCLTRDDTGRELRTFNIDVFPLLTTNQRNNLTQAYNGMLNLVRNNESIPTPTPASTP